MSVRRAVIGGEEALVAPIGGLLKAVLADGRVLFLVPEAEARDWNPFQPRVPRGQSGGGQWSGENLTRDEIVEVKNYTTKAYRHINSTLRQGLAYVLGRTVVHLDSAIKKSVLGKDMTLFRGVKSDRFVAKLEALRPGAEISDEAYTSASGSYLAASQYAGAGRPLMEIFVPSGSNALYTEKISISAGLGEEEYVLPRGSVFRYTGKTGKPGQVRYQFELAPKSAKDWNPFQLRVPKGEPTGGQWQGENLTKQERAEVYFYTGEGYVTINDRLRRDFPVSRAELIDSAIAKSVVDKDVTVYRGVNSLEFVERLDSLRPGDVMTDKAYVSTSGSFLAAAMYGGIGAPAMEIRVPSGSSVLYVEEFSANKGIGEEEYLLPRNSTFRYSGKRTIGGGQGTSKGSTVYTFDLVPHVAKDYDPNEPRVPAGQPGGGQWRGENLSREERAEVVSYTEDSYAAINEALRAGEHQQFKSIQGSVALLDSALAKSVLSSDTVVYRGVSSREFLDQLGTLKPGGEVVDPGYMSTSASLASAATFAGRSVMELRLPAGSNALYVEEFSGNKGAEEDEYLLPRGTTLRYVTSRTVKRTSFDRIYTFDLVPRAAADWNPFQPRVPAGQHGGGEWTEGATGSLVGGATKKGLGPEHVDALKQYTTTVYVPVNQALRSKPQGQMTGMEQAVVKALDEAFDRLPKTTEVMQLFRAAGEEFSAVVDRLKVGADVIDSGFVSTSFDERTARSFLNDGQGERKVLIEIVLPKDSRAIDTNKYNPFKGENETLLPRNTAFRYLGMERDVYRFRANPR